MAEEIMETKTTIDSTNDNDSCFYFIKPKT